MTLEDAVRKMTSLSAARFQLEDRGLLREGYWADITVFDPDARLGPTDLPRAATSSRAASSTCSSTAP